MYTRDDTVIDWARPAVELANFTRAWDPDVGALTTLPDGRRLKVWRAVAETQPPDSIGGEALPPLPWEPGLILAVTKKTVLVATGEGALRLRELQPENKPRMTVGSYLAGNQLAPGERLGQ
jgi:methionyl-tRNA formyltransferase